MRPPERHDLVHPTRAGWEALFTERPALAGIAGLRDWADAGLPVVATRHDASVSRDRWPVAVRLPPACGGARLGFGIDPSLGASVEGPPPLARAAGPAGRRLPRAIRHGIARVLAHAPSAPLMFGSVMWECVSGLGYATDRSDLDLLWPVEPREVDALLGWLRRADTVAPPRLDGEILFRLPEGVAGVQWRELAGGGEVLVKQRCGVRLMDADRLVTGQS